MPPALDKPDPAASESAQLEGAGPEVAPEESANGSAFEEADSSGSPAEPDSVSARDLGEGLETEQGAAKTDYDSEQVGMAGANGPDEPDAEVQLQRNSGVGEREVDTESRQTSIEDPAIAQADSVESAKLYGTKAPEESPTRVEDESNECVVGDGEVGRFQPHSPDMLTGLENSDASSRVGEEQFGLASGQPNTENFVRGWEVSAVYEGGREAREVTGESVDGDTVPTTDLHEVNAPVKIGDSGAHLPETTKLLTGGMDSGINSGDANQREGFNSQPETRLLTEQGSLRARDGIVKEHHAGGRDGSTNPDSANELVNGKTGDGIRVPLNLVDNRFGNTNERQKEIPAIAPGDKVKAPDSGSNAPHGQTENREPRSLENSYTDWRQVAGYFDGDGTADYNVGKRVVHPNLAFTDNYRPHLEMMREFLLSQGVHAEPLHYVGSAWSLKVARAESVQKVASMMEPYLSKKREEVRAILNYYDNKMTGMQLAEAFNESVRIGNRTGKICTANIPYTRHEGQALSKREHAEHAKKMGMENRKLTDDDVEQIRSDITSGVATNGELARKYGVSAATISRAVFGRSDYR